MKLLLHTSAIIGYAAIIAMILYKRFVVRYPLKGTWIIDSLGITYFGWRIVIFINDIQSDYYLEQKRMFWLIADMLGVFFTIGILFITIELKKIVKKNRVNQIPMWFKDKDSVVLWINEAYEDTYLKKIGKKQNDLLNTKGENIFPPQHLNPMLENDKDMLLRGEPESFIELTENGKENYVLKWPVKRVNKTGETRIVGQGGAAIPL